jgi:hypothetical protein
MLIFEYLPTDLSVVETYLSTEQNTSKDSMNDAMYEVLSFGRLCNGYA